jgi:ribosomal protein L16 Arg81 hydroxylase
MDRLKFLEFDISQGKILYIPPYWWYSIQYTSDSTFVCGFTYNSVTNYMANIKDIGLYYLQQSNTKNKITKTIKIPPIHDISVNNDKEEENDEKIENIDI